MRFCAPLIPALLLLFACGGAGDRPGETAAVSAASASAAPAPGGGSKTDAEELRDYTLNMEDVRKWVQAQRTMAAIERESAAATPAADPETETETEETEPEGDSQTLDGIQARVEGIPEFKRVVEATGLGAREYALVTLAYMQAGMATAAVQMGADRDSLATALQINPANVAFIQENEAELNRLMKEMEPEFESQ